jgi:hypothetical protein
MKLQRYVQVISMRDGYIMRQDEQGDYVKYSDVADLEADKQRLIEALKVLLSEARDDVCACLNFELSHRPDKDIVAYYEKQLASIDEILAIKPSEPPPSIQLDDFTLPPVNLESLGRAK